MTESSLYRQQALVHAGERTLGSTLISQPFTLKFLTLFILIISIIAILFLNAGKYARKETVAGYLKPDKGISRVYPQTNGIAEKLMVAEGDLVHKGDALLTVTTAQAMIDGEQADEKLLAELSRQKNELSDSRQRRRNKAELELTWGEAQLRTLHDELTQLEHVKVLQLQRTQVAFKQLNAFQKLSTRGHVASNQLLQAEANLLAEKKELLRISQVISQLESQIRTAQFKLTLIPGTLENELDVLNSKISSINQRVTEISRRANYLVTAPVSGTVTAVNVSEGDAIAGNRVVLSVLPLNSTLFAWLLIPSRAAGLSKAGQSVRLMYDSFPYQQFGTQAGTIVSISEVIVNPQEISGPIQAREPMFIAKVRLDKNVVKAYGEEHLLQPDMLLSADIVQEKRTFLQWMLNPLYALRGWNEA